MAFLLPVLEGLGSGLLGNAIGGAVGTGTAGNVENSAMNALNAQDENFQLGMYASEIQNQEQLQMQSEVFDQMMDERSDSMRPTAAYLAVESLKDVGRRMQQHPSAAAHRKVSSDDHHDSTASPTRRRKCR
jgi:O-acetylhomoserine/O-acetylserine sulfhydrylase-like pyridoxal-dependent enzyme